MSGILIVRSPKLTSVVASVPGDIPTVFTYRWKGEEIAKSVDRGYRVYMYITVGEQGSRPYSGINRWGSMVEELKIPSFLSILRGRPEMTSKDFTKNFALLVRRLQYEFVTFNVCSRFGIGIYNRLSRAAYGFFAKKYINNRISRIHNCNLLFFHILTN